MNNRKCVGGKLMAGLRLGEEECKSLLKLRVGDDISSDDYKEILQLCNKTRREAKK